MHKFGRKMSRAKLGISRHVLMSKLDGFSQCSEGFTVDGGGGFLTTKYKFCYVHRTERIDGDRHSSKVV